MVRYVARNAVWLVVVVVWGCFCRVVRWLGVVGCQFWLTGGGVGPGLGLFGRGLLRGVGVVAARGLCGFG